MTVSANPDAVAADSFIELGARSRARAILDSGSFHELLGPFDRLHSPWLEMQDIVPQEDDGVIVAQGCLDGERAVVIALEGSFQGGSVGEVGGAKIATALELALRDCARGRPVKPVLLLETGGVRLQEATLGLAAIAEVHSAIIELRNHVPVVGVIAGMVGCFGGMAVAAALCSSLIITKQARLGMNGPEVIEREAGVEELDASDRRLIWSVLGGTQRYLTGFADLLIADDCRQIAAAVRAAARQPPSGDHRSEATQIFKRRLESIDPALPPDAHRLRELWRGT
jgi:malonate decarboxylase beta subunit